MGAYTVSTDGYPSAEARLPVFRGTRSPYPSNGYPWSEGRPPPYRGSEKPLTRGTATHFTSAGYTPLPRKWLYLFRGTGFPRPRGRRTIFRCTGPPFPWDGCSFERVTAHPYSEGRESGFLGKAPPFPRNKCHFTEGRVPNSYRRAPVLPLRAMEGYIYPLSQRGIYTPDPKDGYPSSLG